ncbi:MAG: SCP2 domain-containing protein [Gammaproteobacteria bacterium HGW-Gammaproteobacteria-11]|nr:MAG: SCP2 domain-containing protein [Gammaproteobacteria bacterium HGW-Gammaproteobacteria-11]
MLSQALLAGVERSLAAALARDPLTARRLAALQGKVIAIRGSEPDWQLFLLPAEARIDLMLTYDGEADCSLSAPSSLLVRLLVSDQRQALLQDPQVQLSGDSQVLVSLQNALGGLRLDGEAELARWLGPVPAHALAGLLRDGWQWGGQVRQSLGRSLSEYLTEESRQLVGQAEAEVRAEQLYQLRLDLERLEARVQQLEQPDPESPDT